MTNKNEITVHTVNCRHVHQAKNVALIMVGELGTLEVCFKDTTRRTFAPGHWIYFDDINEGGDVELTLDEMLDIKSLIDG